jgi:hypothetical protein
MIKKKNYLIVYMYYDAWVKMLKKTIWNVKNILTYI